MTSTHTPAPWRLDDPIHDHVTKQGDNYHIIDAGDELAGPALGVTGFTIREYMPLADARLIAASPDLLAVTKAAFSIMRGTATDQTDIEWIATVKRLHSAIKKAEIGE